MCFNVGDVVRILPNTREYMKASAPFLDWLEEMNGMENETFEIISFIRVDIYYIRYAKLKYNGRYYFIPLERLYHADEHSVEVTQHRI